jgi:cysteine desulfurase/selenocysteine lyase
MFREEFPILKTKLIYFDNAATTLKPKAVIDAVSDYYTNYSSNSGRANYDIAQKTDKMITETRRKIAEFINANEEEIVFTSGATSSLNMVVWGYLFKYLKEGDEILTTKAEHSSLLVPLIEMCKQKSVKLKYIELNEENHFDLEKYKKAITKNTKAVCLAMSTNLVGDIRPLKEIIEISKSNNIINLIDAAQSIGRINIDVLEMDIDFLAFSGHKMFGPTGVGVLFGKHVMLKGVIPQNYGGGMVLEIDENENVIYKKAPYSLEGGTLPIASIIGLSRAVDLVKKVSPKDIKKIEQELATYLLKRLKEIQEVHVYNDKTQSGIVAFNYEGVFAEDLAYYLSKHNIAIRAGNHCVKKIFDLYGINNVCRISLSFYNTKKEIDTLIKVLKNTKIKEDIIF